MAIPSREREQANSHHDIANEREELNMPNIKSAEKRLRQNVKRRLRNMAVKSAMKTAIKKALSAKGADAALRAALSAIDRAAAKGVIHKNAAARKKSRLVKKLAKA